MKFVKNPGPHWNFQPLTNMWDPDFIEGGRSSWRPTISSRRRSPIAGASDS